jgi:hypothetical protein
VSGVSGVNRVRGREGVPTIAMSCGRSVDGHCGCGLGSEGSGVGRVVG